MRFYKYKAWISVKNTTPQSHSHSTDSPSPPSDSERQKQHHQVTSRRSRAAKNNNNEEEDEDERATTAGSRSSADYRTRWPPGTDPIGPGSRHGRRSAPAGSDGADQCGCSLRQVSGKSAQSGSAADARRLAGIAVLPRARCANGCHAMFGHCASGRHQPIEQYSKCRWPARMVRSFGFLFQSRFWFRFLVLYRLFNFRSSGSLLLISGMALFIRFLPFPQIVTRLLSALHTTISVFSNNNEMLCDAVRSVALLIKFAEYKPDVFRSERVSSSTDGSTV